jgi:hypothetical protein
LEHLSPISQVAAPAEECEREHKLARWPCWCSVIGFSIKHPRSTFIGSLLPSGSLFNGDHPMRLPLILPANLTAEQRPLYEDMRRGIETNFKGFKAIAVNGELVGPWNPWLHFPKFGGPVWELVKALSTSPSLPKSVREVAILVTGAQFRSAYEIYAHVLVAEARGLPTW